MLAFPADAAAIPAPEPVPAVVTVTFGYCRWYPAAHAPMRGNSSVLPVSVRVCGPAAGVSTGAPAPDDAADNAGADVPDAEPPLLPHATVSMSGTAATAASSNRYRDTPRSSPECLHHIALAPVQRPTLLSPLSGPADPNHRYGASVNTR